MKSLRDESAHSEPLKLFVVAWVLFDALVLIRLFSHSVPRVGGATRHGGDFALYRVVVLEEERRSRSEDILFKRVKQGDTMEIIL